MLRDAAPWMPSLLGNLEVGLAGPPVVAPDGSWWLLGRDGELEHFRRDDALLWSISLPATITGAAAADELGLLFVPTARDLVFAVEPSGTVRWRFRAPAGIVGPVGWVPGQGLALVGRDRAVYWLDRRANLLLRAPIGARVSAGPAPIGNKIVVGTDAGQLIALTRQGRRQSTQLDGPITAIEPMLNGAIVLCAGKAYGLNHDAQILWTKEGILGIGVTAALGQTLRQNMPAILSTAGKVIWLDGSGQTTASIEPSAKFLGEPLAEFAATDRQAWIVDDSGTLWEASIGGGWRSVQLTQSPLMRPVVDVHGSRVLIGSVGGGGWSVPIGTNQ